MTVVNTQAISKMLLPNVRQVFSDLSTKGDQWREIFKVIKSDKKREYYLETFSTASAAHKPEGAVIDTTDVGQFVETMIENQGYAVSVIFTRESIQDNLYKQQFPQLMRSMIASLIDCKNIVCANILNSGFDTNQPIGDGQPLFSTTHPTRTGTFANTTSTAADLSETNLEDGITTIQLFPNAAGIQIHLNAIKLIIPTNQQFQAKRLLNSRYRVGTANNDINALYNDYIANGYFAFSYITLPTFWMLLTNEENGFIYQDRDTNVEDVSTSSDTFNVKVTKFERYGVGVLNARAAYGAVGL